MVSEGYLAAGYEYLGIDDCWLEKKRGSDGRLVPDQMRFPNGMKAVADYVSLFRLTWFLFSPVSNFLFSLLLVSDELVIYLMVTGKCSPLIMDLGNTRSIAPAYRESSVLFNSRLKENVRT